GPLGVDTSTNAALDVNGTYTGNFNSHPVTLAALEVGGTTGLYSINLTSGAATAINTIGTGATPLIDIAIAPTDPPIAVGGSLNGQVLPLDVGTGQAVAGTALTPFPGLNVNVRSTMA